jgi:hypothetical protein
MRTSIHPIASVAVAILIAGGVKSKISAQALAVVMMVVINVINFAVVFNNVRVLREQQGGH